MGCLELQFELLSSTRVQLAACDEQDGKWMRGRRSEAEVPEGRLSVSEGVNLSGRAKHKGSLYGAHFVW